MNIFNSLGSNYDLRFAFQALFTRNKITHFAKLKSYLEKKYQGEAVLVYKGREALELALNILNLPDSAYIAINGFTCYAVYKAIINAKKRVDYVDLPETDLNFSADNLQNILQKNPSIKVVVIQNTLGYPCDIEKIFAICKQNNIIIIEDLAHSAGAVYNNGKEAGTVGDFVILSFSQDKIVDAISGGGLIIRNKQYQNIKRNKPDEINIYRQWRDRYYPLLTWLIRKTHNIGIGKVLHSFFRSLGLLSLPMSGIDSSRVHTLPGWYCDLAYKGFIDLQKNISHRRSIANTYLTHLDSELLKSGIAQNINRSTNLRFPLLIGDRDRLIADLKKCRIYISDIWYDAPIAPKRFMPVTDYDGQCPKAEEISEKILNLPTHNNITIEQAEILAKKINLWRQSS